MNIDDDKKSWFIPDDMRQEILEMFEDGLIVSNIAWYMGVSHTTVKNIVSPGVTREYRKKYRSMPGVKEKMSAAHKRYISTIRGKQAVKKSIKRKYAELRLDPKKWAVYLAKQRKYSQTPQRKEWSRLRDVRRRKARITAKVEKLRSLGLHSLAERYLELHPYDKRPSKK